MGKISARMLPEAGAGVICRVLRMLRRFAPRVY
jgi:hypothetical protein